ncbi:MAG: aldehyde dehydrogenase family protein [Kibdelosporangium sp.]
MTEMIPALGARGPYQTQRREVLTDVTGKPVAEMSLVPPLFVDLTVRAMRAAKPMPAGQRIGSLRRAGEIFAGETVAGQSVEDYWLSVCRVGGVPLPVVRGSTEIIENATRTAQQVLAAARPNGAVDDWRDPLTFSGRSVWTRKGEVLGVVAAGNHPGVHAFWLEALALGYRVAVRPSRREPFTPYRLVSALRAAGFGDDQVAFLPSDHATADVLVRTADLSLVYGGDNVMDTYGTNPGVLVQGPGRAKIFIDADTDWRAHLDAIVTSVAHNAGLTCVNTTAVLVEGDHVPVAEAIADALATLPSLRPEEEKAALPVEPMDSATRLGRYLHAQSTGTRRVMGAGPFHETLGDGTAVLRPAVFAVPSASAPQTRIEMPFPCVWVAPWSPDDGLAPMRDSLVLTAMTNDESLIDSLLATPSISNVYVGANPTTWFGTGIPHDGYLADFLMRNKAFIR